MKITTDWKLNLKTEEAQDKVKKANQAGMRDTVVDIWGDAIKDSPKLTGHNMRSITAEVSGMGTVKQGKDAEPERVVDNSKMEGAVYSTSGYGGTLETGSAKMAPRPYFKPALDRNFTAEKFAENIKRYLK